MVGSTSATVFCGHDEAWPSEETFLDSRFRGNDRARGVQRGEAPLRYLFTPMSGGQGVDSIRLSVPQKKHGGQNING